MADWGRFEGDQERPKFLRAATNNPLRPGDMKLGEDLHKWFLTRRGAIRGGCQSLVDRRRGLGWDGGWRGICREDGVVMVGVAKGRTTG